MAGSVIADPALAPEGEARIDWADGQMPVLRSIRERFARRAAAGGRARRRLPARHRRDGEPRPHAAWPGGAERRAVRGQPAADAGRRRGGARRADGAEVHAAPRRGRRRRTRATSPRSSAPEPADHARRRRRPDQRPARRRPDAADGILGGTEETTTGLLRLRAMQARGRLALPGRSRSTRRAPSARSTTATAPASRRSTASCARRTCCSPAARSSCSATAGPAAASRSARAGAGATVIVCEVDPMRALEARMEGFEVMPALEAAERGDVFITVTGARDVLRREHFERMKDGAVLANAGHFDVEIYLAATCATPAGRVREVRPLVEQYDLGGPAPEPARQRPRREPRRGGGPSGRGHGPLVRRARRSSSRTWSRARRALGPGVHAGPGGDRPRGRAAEARVARRRDRRAASDEQERTCAAGPPARGSIAARGRACRRASRRCARTGCPTRRSRRSANSTRAGRRARPGCCRRPRSSRSTSCRRSTSCPSRRRRARGARRDRRAQAQRRARHEHGHDEGRSRCWRSRTA